MFRNMIMLFYVGKVEDRQKRWRYLGWSDWGENEGETILALENNLPSLDFVDCSK